MPHAALPMPEHWRSRPIFTTLVGIVTLALTAAAGYWTLGLITRQEYLTAAFAAGATLSLLALTIVFVVQRAGWVSVRGEADGTATHLHPDPVSRVATIAALAFLLPTSILFAVFAPQGALDISMERHFMKAEIAAVVVAVASAVGLVMLILHRNDPQRIDLSPTGFSVTEWKSWSADWDDIVEVTSDSPLAKRGFPIVIRVTGEKSHSMSSPMAYTPGGRALYWLFWYYWRHPALRDELADGRALDRLREQRFDLD